MGKLSKALQTDIEQGVPFTIELSTVKLNSGLNIYATGRIKRKQRPKSVKKYPAWAKRLQRNERICVALQPQHFDKDLDGVETHIKNTLGNVLTEGTVVAYITEHRVKKESDKNEAASDRELSILSHYDHPGIFIARQFEVLKYESDSEDSE